MVTKKNQDLNNTIDSVLDNLSYIKFYIGRYLETKNKSCIKRALEEAKISKNNVLKILENNKGDEKVEKIFSGLLETLDETDQVIAAAFKGELWQR